MQKQAQQPQRRDQPLALLAPQLHQPKHHQYWPKLQHQHQWCRQPHRRQHCKQPRPCKEHRYLRCERQRQHCMFKSQQQCSASPSLQRLLWSQALPQWQSLWRWSNRPKCQLPSWHQSRLYRLRLSQKQGFRRRASQYVGQQGLQGFRHPLCQDLHWLGLRPVRKSVQFLWHLLRLRSSVVLGLREALLQAEDQSHVSQA